MAGIVERAVRDLIPYARNPRKNDAVVDQMAASIREFGFKVPILALSDRTIVDGHLRLKAAQKLNIEKVPVILCDEWTPVQVKAFRLMANKSVSWVEWDAELLRFEMEDLKSVARSSGPSRNSPSAAAIITGSTNPAGLRSERAGPATGTAT